MHHGTSDDREGRWLARDHAVSPRYENPGRVRAYRKRRCARAARRVLRRAVDDVSMTDIEAEIFAAIEAEAHAYDEAAAREKETEEAIAWEDHAWGNYNPYDDYYYYGHDRDDWMSDDRMWADHEWDCVWSYLYGHDYSADYDGELRSSAEDARERALDVVLYLQGEDPKGSDAEAATSREGERERLARRFHQKYHRD